MTTLNSRFALMNASASRKRLLLFAAILGIAGVFGIMAALGQAGMAMLAVIAAVGAALVLMHPKLGTMVVLFGMYLNAPVVAIHYHDMPSFLAVAFPLILIVPLNSVLLLRRGEVVFDKIFGCMILFLAVQTFSALFATNIGAATDAILNYVVEGLMLYFLLVNVLRDEADLRQAIWAVVIAGAIMGGIVLYQEVTKTFTNEYGGFGVRMASFQTEAVGVWRDRTSGSIGDPNFFAQVLLVLVPLGLFRFWGERSRWLRILALGATLLIIAGVVLTFSRGAGLALMGVLAAIAYLWRIKPHYIALSLVGMLVFIRIVAPDYISRVQTVSDASGLVDEDSVARDKSILGRATENLAAIYMFLDHPLIGVGPDNYPVLYESYAEPIGLNVRFRERPAHNLYLSIAAEMGVVGLVTFLSIVGLQLQRLLQLRRYRAELAEVANLATAAAISLLAYLMTGMFLHMAYQRYFWIMMSLCSVAALIGARRVAELNRQKQQTIVEVATYEPGQQ